MTPFIVCATHSMRSYASQVIESLSKYLSFSKIAEQINGLDLLNTDRFADGEMEVSVNYSIHKYESVHIEHLLYIARIYQLFSTLLIWKAVLTGLFFDFCRYKY